MAVRRGGEGGGGPALSGAFSEGEVRLLREFPGRAAEALRAPRV
ncbi:hypothetical protein [Streptomyces albireticuli]|nr:hypothetical protein [Streptomyces albireticuli]